jgi:hypothetical protein
VKSSQTSDYYQNTDGSVTEKFAEGPVNFRDASGSWRPIDTALVQTKGGGWHEKANSVAVSFAPSGGSEDLTAVGLSNSESVTSGLAGAAAVRPMVSGSQITYAGVLPSTDLVAQPTATGMKESLVLHSANTPSSWVYPLRLKGLRPVLAADGSVHLIGANGKTAAVIPLANVTDSKNSPRSGEPVTTHAVTYQLTTLDGVPALAETLDPAWLQNPARVFPVTVGTLEVEQPAPTAYADPGNGSADTAAQTISVGFHDSGKRDAGSFLRFPASRLGGSKRTVSSVSLSMFDSSSDNTATVPLSTATVQRWADSVAADGGLTLYPPASENLNWSRFASLDDPSQSPMLSVTYSASITLPTVSAQYPADQTVSNTTTPTLSAAGADDPSLGIMPKLDFQVYDASGATKVADSGLVAAPSDPGVAAWTVPAGKLTWNKSYYWTVQSYDGTNYSASPVWHSISIQVPQPAITSLLSQNTGGHGYDPSIGNYTTSATDANVTTVGPSLTVERDYNSLDPRIAGAFGASWSSIFDARATAQYDSSGAVASVVVTYPDGSEVGYGKNSDGSFTAPEGRFATLKAVTGGYTLTDKNDTTYTFTDSLGSGAYGITAVTDSSGRAVNFTWSSGEITTMTSAVSGRALHLTWAPPSGTIPAHVTSVSTDQATAGNSSTCVRRRCSSWPGCCGYAAASWAPAGDGGRWAAAGRR